jgi:hypothetical protein
VRVLRITTNRRRKNVKAVTILPKVSRTPSFCGKITFFTTFRPLWPSSGDKITEIPFHKTEKWLEEKYGDLPKELKEFLHVS